MSYTISNKGQVTLPVKVRMQIGVKPGDEIEYVIEKGQVILRPVRGKENPFARWVGAASGSFKNRAEIHAWIRDLRDEEA